MFVGPVDLENGTMLELVIIPLKGTALSGQWNANTDLMMLCDVQHGRCCTCHLSDHPSRFVEKLALPPDDAERLSNWLKTNLLEIEKKIGEGGAFDLGTLP